VKSSATPTDLLINNEKRKYGRHCRKYQHFSIERQNMLVLKRGTVELCDHDKAWEQNAAQSIEKLKAIFGNFATDIQHIGSTSIVNIKAKPIIDITVTVSNFDEVMKLVPALERSGFMYRQHNVAGDMLFVCGDRNTDIRTHHVHVVITGSKE